MNLATLSLFFALVGAEVRPRPDSSRLCARQNVDCSFLVPSSKSCTVEYFRTNGPECGALDFDSDKEPTQLGRVDVAAFVWHYSDDVEYSHFNVSFADVRWKQMTFRFRAAESNKTKELKNHCRRIVVDSEAPPSDSLRFDYDCHWSDQQDRYENETFIFESLGVDGDRSDYRKMVFKVPSVRFIESNAPFIYVDLTHPKSAVLHVRRSDSDTSKSYRIEQCSYAKEQNSMQATCKEIVANVDYHHTTHQLQPGKPAWYFFRVSQPNSECSSGCDSIDSVEFFIDSRNIVFTVLWNVLWICLAFGVVFAIVWIVKRLRRRFTPKVLLVYSHGDARHRPVYDAVRAYMQSELGWSVAWDEEVEVTQHADPYIWCLDACAAADCVLYFSPPSRCVTEHRGVVQAAASANVHMHDIFLKAIKIASQRKRRIAVFNVAMGGCGPPADAPAELCKARTFELMREWRDLLNAVLKNNWLDERIRPVPKLGDSAAGKALLSLFPSSGL